MADPGDGQVVSGVCHSVMGASLWNGCGDTERGRGKGLHAAQGWSLANGLGFLGGEVGGEERKKEDDFPPVSSSPGLSKPGC